MLSSVRPVCPIVLVMFLLVACVQSADFSISPAIKHFGACDGSDGIPIGHDHFISASDEDNILRAYSIDPDSRATKLDVPLSLWLKAPRKENHPDQFRECDIEGATRVGHRVYWIGSHARDKDGKICPEREVLFATDIDDSADKTKVSLVRQGPYRTLIADILAASTLAEIHSAISAAHGQTARDKRKVPTKKGALNIEALCSDGKALLIGFRNPIPRGKALLIPLTNPDAVLKGEHATFDPPIFLDLGGLGFRDMVRWKDGFLIIAGDYRENSDKHAQKPRLFEWQGRGKAPTPIDVPLEKDFNPEGAVVFGDSKHTKVLLLSDDGTLEVDHSKMKDLKESKQCFRTVWLEDIRE